MKTRIISLLLAFAMAVSLAPAALAAPGEYPPYSLKYLNGIEGSEFLDYVEMDDDVMDTGEPVTQLTFEAYDVFDRYMAASGDWKTIIDPFCQRFIEAGFDSWTSSNSYNETEYYFENGTGDRYVIMGEKFGRQLIDESGIVQIMHAYSTGYIEEEAPDQSGPSATPYSLKYLDGIEGVEYVDCVETDDDVLNSGEPITQCTIEIYDAFDLYMASGGDWQATIDPFCQRFIEAGFDSWTSTNNSYNEPEYYFENGTGDRFVIWGEKLTQEFAQGTGSKSGIVCISHFYSTGYIHGEEAPDQSDPSSTPETPANPPAQAAPSLDNFVKSQTYTPGQFTDVPADRWFASSVQTAYELGLVAGVDTNTFAPADPITIAQTLVLASRIHSIYYGNSVQFVQGSPWYQVYVDYAAANGILSAGAVADYNAPANRQIFALIMANALPESALPAINTITAESIPDSSGISASFLPAVLRLYNAGVLTGSDAYGTFNPAGNVQRSEVAAIVARMAIPGERKSFTPQPKPAPAPDPEPTPEPAPTPEPTPEPAPETPTTPTTANKDIPASIVGIVPSSAPTTVLDSSATRFQVSQLYYNYMSTTVTGAGMQISFAESYIKSGSRAWDNYMSYVAKGQGKSLSALEWQTKATEDNVHMMEYLRKARPYLEAISFGASLYPSFFSEVAKAANDASSSLHSLAMSPDMSIAAIRLITLQGDMELLEMAIDNAKAKIDAMS